MQRYLYLLSVALFKNVIAGAMGPVTAPNSWSSFITVSAAPGFVEQGNAQILTLLPPFQNYYTLNSDWRSFMDLGVFLGLESLVLKCSRAQIGLSGYLATSSKVNGHVWQFASPEFDNFSYSYRISHKRIMASTKLYLTQYNSLLPYFSGEIGVAFNRSYSYQEIPLIPEVVSMVPFNSHSVTSFAWSIGLGVDYPINQKVRIGTGYLFSNLGKSSLGTTPAQVTEENLQISHRYANQVRFQLTYLV
ncbi:TPA: hypothetical protein RJX14_003087 [Legionella pneumophila]|nr:hypothetical protein [Legionella pneumophila]HDV6634249.1 hypothetical protein [Legionella pneumophila]